MTDFSLDEAIDILSQCDLLLGDLTRLQEKAQKVVDAAPFVIEFIPDEPPPKPELRLVKPPPKSG